MRSICQSALAVMMALVSTAAFGPGMFFIESATAFGRPSMRAILPDAPSSPDLQSFMRYVEPGADGGMPVALLADESPEIADFLAVDLTQASGNSTVLLAAGPAFFAGITGGESPVAGGGYGYGNASTGGARLPGQYTRLASNVRLPAAATGLLSGFDARTAPALTSALSLDDPALVDRNIEQLPYLPLTSMAADLETGGQAGNAAANAVPEPTTIVLLGLGLLGLLAARRTESPFDPALPA